jgi:hypothetical protein
VEVGDDLYYNILVAEWITIAIATAFRTQLAKIIKRPW